MPIQILLAVYLDPQVKDFAFIRDAKKHADCIQKGKASVLAQLQDVDVPAVPAAQDNDHMAKLTLYGSALAKQTTSMVPGVGAVPSTPNRCQVFFLKQKKQTN